jgi:hypothetical protein
MLASLPFPDGLSFFLARIERNRLIEAINGVAWKSSVRPGSGLKSVPRYCDTPSGSNSFFSETGVRSEFQQACWGMYPVNSTTWLQWADRSIKMHSSIRAAAGALTVKGIPIPNSMVAVRFLREESWGVLDAVYYFNPEAEGISSIAAASVRDMDWHVTNIDRYPEKVAYANKLKEWAASMWPKLKLTFAEAQ